MARKAISPYEPQSEMRVAVPRLPREGALLHCDRKPQTSLSHRWLSEEGRGNDAAQFAN